MSKIDKKLVLAHFYVNRKDKHNVIHSLGNMRLASYVAKGISELKIEILDLNIEESLKKTLNKFNGNFSIVGLSVNMWSHKKILKLAKMIKEKYPDILLVAGGPDILYADYDIWPKGTIFIVGEGEVPLRKICKDYLTGKLDYKNLPDSTFSNVDNRTEKRINYVIQEALPEDSFNLFSKEFFSRVDLKINTDHVLLWETSRGCPYNCGYCGHKQRKRAYDFSVERMKEEIIGMKNLNIKRIFITDPILGGTKKRAITILNFLKEYIPETELMFYLRPEYIDEELVDSLKEANIYEISVGLQTTNPFVPSWVRNNQMELVLKNLKNLGDSDIQWRLEFITGLPGDTIKGLRESLFFGMKMNPTWIFSYPLTSIHGTKIDEIRDSCGDEFWITADKNNRVTESNSFSKDEFRYMLEYGNAMCGLYNALARLRIKMNFKKIEQKVIKEINNKKFPFETNGIVEAGEYWESKLKNLNLE